MVENSLHIFKAEDEFHIDIPYSEDGVKAGFPSPAQDYMNEAIDLNRLIIKHKETTFYARVSGTSMKDAGIEDGDLVVIDKLLEASEGNYVVAYIDGEFTLKEFRKDESGKCAWLMPANSEYSPIKVTEENEFIIWGVVTYVIKKMR